MTTVFRVVVEDRPGEFARLAEALGAAGVNIEGFCGLGVEGRGHVCFAVEDAEGARRALEGAGAQVAAELDAIVVDVAADADRPGVAGELARKVADAGVNVEVALVATHDRIVLATSDDERARAALGL